MTKSSARDIFLEAVRGERTSRPAVATVDQSATFEQMDTLGVRWPDAHTDAKLMARLAIGAYSILGFDAVKVPFCQTIEQEALGCKVHMGDDQNLPSIAEHPYDLSAEPVQDPVFPQDFLTRSRVPVLIEAVKIVKKEVGDKVAVIGGIIGPFSVVAALVGIKQCFKHVVKSPARLQPFLDLAVRCGVELAGALADAGADAICIEDMMASVSMISPRCYSQSVVPYESELIGKIGIPTILHICGNVDSIIKDMISTGTTAISFEPKTDINAVKEAVEAAGRKVGLIGGVDALDDLFYGKPGAVREAALLGREHGYSVIAPSCSIPPATATDNLRAMVEAVKSN